MRRVIFGFATAFLVFGIAAQASALQYILNDSFGSDPVSGDIVIDITDGVADTVHVSIDLTGLNSTEFTSGLYLNTLTEVTGATGPSLDSFDWLADPAGDMDASHKADGDGYHKLVLSFPTANNDPDRLTGGVGAIYIFTLTGLGLDASDFEDIGSASSKGQFHAVARMQSTGPDGEGSDWVGDGGDPIPEPSGVVLFSAGMAVVATSMRRRRG